MIKRGRLTGINTLTHPDGILSLAEGSFSSGFSIGTALVQLVVQQDSLIIKIKLIKVKFKSIRHFEEPLT